MDLNFDRDVLQRSCSIPVLIQFSAEGCGPCKWVEQTWLSIVRKKKGRVEYLSVPLKKQELLIETLEIKSNPTTLFFAGGKERGRINGALPEIAFEQWLEDQLVTQ